MKLLRGAFKFIVGFGCTAFFLFWILSKFMQVEGGMAFAIMVFALLVGIVSAVEKDEEDGKEG